MENDWQIARFAIFRKFEISLLFEIGMFGNSQKMKISPKQLWIHPEISNMHITGFKDKKLYEEQLRMRSPLRFIIGGLEGELGIK